jgi:hypothetical protein
MLPLEVRKYKRDARHLGISLVKLFRRLFRTLLPSGVSKPWMRYAGMIETGDPKSSQKVDDVVYGPGPNVSRGE